MIRRCLISPSLLCDLSGEFQTLTWMFVSGIQVQSVLSHVTVQLLAMYIKAKVYDVLFI